jgi:hypothetical protein
MEFAMKIALVLSGQLRSVSEGFKYIKQNLLDHYDVDVFFHTWVKNWDRNAIDLYKPKDALIEEDSIFGNFPNYRIVSSSHPARNTILMYRSIKYADMLRKNSHTEYDWIIRTRFDFALNTKIQFNQLDRTKMYFCNTRSNIQSTEVHDQFALATPNDMSIYSSVYDNIHSYHSEGCVVNGEDLLIYHLAKNKCNGSSKIKYIDLNPPFIDGKYNCGKHSLIRNDMEKWH